MTTPESAGIYRLVHNPHWYTISECQKTLRVSRATIFRYLRFVPLTQRVKVTKRVRGCITTRFWRISEEGLRILGHRTGQAPYL